MKEKRLLNELGNVNDEFIEQAKPKIKRYRKKLYAAIGSVAAAAAVFVAVFATGNGLLKNSDNDFNNSSSAITNESTNETTALAYRNINIYYLNGSSTEKTTKYLPCDAKVIFSEWKKLNSIGDDVRFIKCFINSNGKEEINESTVGYIVGDKATLELTISEDIKKYYDKYGEEALLASLEKTFTEYSDFCTDYKLIIK